MTSPRHHITPGDGPAHVAARRMGLSEDEFTNALPALRRRGFPAPDPTTGLYDLTAIDEWRKRRHPHLYGTAPIGALDAAQVVGDRLKNLRRNGVAG